MSAKLKIAVLSDGISTGSKIYRQLSEIDGIDVFLILCNNHKMRKISYIARTFGAIALHLPLRMKFKILKNICCGNVIFLLYGLKDPVSLKKLQSEDFDIGIHDSEIIYTKNLISKFKRGILNSHIGLLPRYRGRCVMEWSIYEGSPTGITVFYIDEGIDTGREIVIREEVSVKDCKNISEAKTKLFNLAPEFYAKAVKNELEGKEHLLNDGSGPRFYVMSNKLKAEVEKYFL